jgi:hypothetical protein
VKKVLITLSIIFGLAVGGFAADKKVKAPITPNPTEFAHLLVKAYGGDDLALDELEMIKVLVFLKAHLPEQTTPTTMSTRLIREKNVRGAARGDLTEERFALREYPADAYAGKFIEKYDRNGDNILSRMELTDGMANIMGMPKAKKVWKKRIIANR